MGGGFRGVAVKTDTDALVLRAASIASIPRAVAAGSICSTVSFGEWITAITFGIGSGDWPANSARMPSISSPPTSE